MNKPGVLLIGSFLSSKTGTRSVGEELSARLSAGGWSTFESSHEVGRIPRLTDMLMSIVAHRKKYQVAYVEVYSGPAFIWAEIVVRMLAYLHKPVVLALHGGGLAEFGRRNRSRMESLLQAGKRITTPSLYLQAGLNCFHHDICYLPNAVDVSQYEFQLRAAPAPRLIWLRAFHEIYQPDLAVRVLASLLNDFDNATLTMIGPDKGGLSSCLAWARTLGVMSHTNIVGPIHKSDVPAWLSKGDIFLNTTRLESFGVSVVEAALMGLPIVTTNVGELAYLWESDKSAMLVAGHDPQAFAKGIRRILTEPGFSEQLSRNARRTAEQFDWSRTLPQWHDLLREAASC